MVIAHHLIWTVYGTWLPNDLRGSGSRELLSEKLAALGAVHFGRKVVQPRRDDVREFYAQAEPLLAHPVIRLDEPMRAATGEALGESIRKDSYTCWACAVMPDHLHLVIRKHRHKGEEMIERLQDATRDWLNRKRMVARDHPVWTEGGWKVFLDSPTAVRGRVAYVEENPEKAGFERQDWPFVVAYDGWGAGLNRKR